MGGHAERLGALSAAGAVGPRQARAAIQAQRWRLRHELTLFLGDLDRAGVGGLGGRQRSVGRGIGHGGEGGTETYGPASVWMRRARAKAVRRSAWKPLAAWRRSSISKRSGQTSIQL